MTVQGMDKNIKLKIAAILCWVLGILNLISAVVVGIPALANHEPVAYALLMLVVGVGLCFSGYSLQQRHDHAAIVAVCFAFLSFRSPPVVGLVLGAAIIFFIAMTWQESL